MRRFDQITELVGRTPIVRLNKVVPADAATVWVKLEFYNPSGSVKDRMALSIIEDAERTGALKSGDTIVEYTSGNTGIGLAFVAAQRGYRLKLIVPDIMSKEKMAIMRAYGAELINVPAGDSIGMDAAYELARDMAERYGYFMPDQCGNPANPRIHEVSTGPEIVDAFRDDRLDGFVAGIGTGGTISGAGHVLRKWFPAIKIYAVEPARSAVLSGGEAGTHFIEGNGAGFVPDTLDTDIYGGVLTVMDEDAIEMCRRVAKEEGILIGISSGSAICAAIRVAVEMKPNQQILTVAPDRGDRYIHKILDGLSAEEEQMLRQSTPIEYTLEGREGS